jgi:methylphosphotriester-DNA--protein-cysteine methyltransferase
MAAYEQSRINPNVLALLCHTSNKEAAEWVAREHELLLAHTSQINSNEIFVCLKVNIHRLIASRKRTKEMTFDDHIRV